MATILSVDEVREHIESDLVDSALTRLVEDADQEIIDRLGPLAEDTKTFEGDVPVLALPRKASSITSAVELIDRVEYTLEDDDFALLADGFSVERRQGSGYPALCWRGQVTLVFVPAGETTELPARKRLLVDLVKLTLAFSGMASESAGESSTRGPSSDYQAQRDALFAQLLSRGRRLPIA